MLYGAPDAKGIDSHVGSCSVNELLSGLTNMNHRSTVLWLESLSRKPVDPPA